MPVCRRLVHAAAVALFLSLGLTATAQSPTAPSISQQDLRTWLTYIASDALQGRQVYSEGLGLAATYIASYLEQWRVPPAGDNGTYFQTVRVQGVKTTSRSSVTVTVNGQSRTFKDGEGVTFSRNQGKKQSLTGAAGFTGYGVSYAPLNGFRSSGSPPSDRASRSSAVPVCPEMSSIGRS